MSNDCSQKLPLPVFDRELSLEELVPATERKRLVMALQDMLGTAIRITTTEGGQLCGEAFALPAQREPLQLDMEPIGYLEVQHDVGDRLAPAVAMMQMLLRGSARYIMASDLHLQAVHEDYEELQRKHAALTESEARYRELARHLEQRVVEQVGTIETAQRQLYQAEKMASVGQLAAGVAHEINNPIGFIRSNLNTAVSYVNSLSVFAQQFKAPASEDQLRAAWQEDDLDYVIGDFTTLLAESIDGADRVAGIVKDLKGFSNVDRSDEEVIDINECLRSVCNVAGNELSQHADLQLDLGELPPICCRPGHIGQVFLNLLLNAARAVEGQGKVTVCTFCEDNRICIQFKDTGAGIDPEIVERIFDPFFTTCEVGQGTGLGLTVSRDIVKAHDGDIKIQSEQGKGTTVSVWLPVVV